MRARLLAIAAALALGTSVSAAATGGDLAINPVQSYGDWAQGVTDGSVPANWYPAAADGRVFVKGLPEGYHTLGISRAFGLGPLVMPRVWVADGKTTQLDLRFHTDYYAPPGERSITGRVFIQPFVARGTSIIKAAAFLATLPEPRRVRYSITEAGPEGARVGREAFRSPDLNAFVAAWNHGDVPVTPGRLYCLRVEVREGAPVLDIKLSDAVDQSLTVVVDGQPVPGASLAGFVASDPPGIITSQACVEGWLRPEPQRELCNNEQAQTFVATGTSLALVDFRPYIPDVEGNVRFEVNLRQGGTTGGSVVRRIVEGPNGSVLQAVWEPGQARLIPGQLYSIDIQRPAGGPFKVYRVAHEVNPTGTCFCDDQPVLYHDLDMNIVEYGPDAAAPAAPSIRVLSGDGLTRVEYTAPDDLDVRKIQIRYRQGEGGEAWPLSTAQDHLLAEVDVVPGQSGVVHHMGVANAQVYLYAAYAVDLNGNYSPAAVNLAWPGKGPVLPAQATVVNGLFAETRARGAQAAGWEIRVDAGDPVWGPSTEGDGATGFGWTAEADSRASLFQTLTLQPGRKYEVTVRAKANGAAAAGIRPEGAPEAALAPVTVEWRTLKSAFTATRSDTAIYLVGATTGAGGVWFSDLRIVDVTMR
jgi:hypothetical protein